MTAEIAFERKKQMGLITLKRPQALNALNLPMIKALQQQLLQWQEDESIHAVVIQAEEGKAFCAGGDVRWLYDSGLAKNPEQMQFFWHEYRLNHFIHQFKKPYIALMDGITMGGGVGISMHGSHPVATERFVFAMPETGIGFFPDVGASYLLAHCPGKTGVYLGLTGNRLRAAEAQALGLIKEVVDSQQLPAIVTRLCESDLSTNAHQTVTAILKEFAQPKLRATIEEEREAIDACFARPSVEEIMIILHEKGDEWSLATEQILKQKAPLSLKVTLEQINKAKTLSMAECVTMDYCLVKHFMEDSDFYEGVRALLVDKDKSPHWQPERLDLVTDAKVADYFESGTTFSLIHPHNDTDS